jgi:hypothetical protein
VPAQATYRLQEPSVSVRVREVDLPILKEVLPSAKDKFQKVLYPQRPFL